MDSDEYSINKIYVMSTEIMSYLDQDAGVLKEKGFLVVGKIRIFSMFQGKSQSPLEEMKDFLTIYNKMAERCFNHCIDNFNCRELTSAEEKCIENCSSKGLGANQKLMLTYIEVQPQIVNKRAEEIQQQQSIAEANNNSPSSS